MLNGLFHATIQNLQTTKAAYAAAEDAKRQAEATAAAQSADRSETAQFVSALGDAFSELARGNLSAAIQHGVPLR